LQESVLLAHFLNKIVNTLVFEKVHLEEIAKQERKEATRHSAVLGNSKIVSRMRQPVPCAYFDQENWPGSLRASFADWISERGVGTTQYAPH
jgi:hypothetical protein